MKNQKSIILTLAFLLLIPTSFSLAAGKSTNAVTVAKNKIKAAIKAKAHFAKIHPTPIAKTFLSPTVVVTSHYLSS